MAFDASLATARLTLRPCGLGDVDALRQLWTDPEVRRFLWDDRMIGRDEVQAVVASSIETFASKGYGQWILLPSAGPEALVGFCGLRAIGDGPEIELLYGLAPAHWGHGLAREAANEVLAYGFERVGLLSIAGRVDSPNQRSRKVLEGLGMQGLGERLVEGRPTLHFAISREAFRAMRRREPLS